MPPHRARLIGFPFREHLSLVPVKMKKNIAAGAPARSLIPADSEKDVRIAFQPAGFGANA